MNIHNIPDPAIDGALPQTCLTNKPANKAKPAIVPTPAQAQAQAQATAKPIQPQSPTQPAAKAWRGPWWKN